MRTLTPTPDRPEFAAYTAPNPDTDLAQLLRDWRHAPADKAPHILDRINTLIAARHPGGPR